MTHDDTLYHADTGAPVTDAEREESERRQREAEALGDDAATWTPISEYEGPE